MAEPAVFADSATTCATWPVVSATESFAFAPQPRKLDQVDPIDSFSESTRDGPSAPMGIPPYPFWWLYGLYGL
jgi:hypothetical protein